MFAFQNRAEAQKTSRQKDNIFQGNKTPARLNIATDQATIVPEFPEFSFLFQR